MEINVSDYQRIINELNELEGRGFTYVTYFADGPTINSCDELECFQTTYDAAEHCYESSTDVDIMHYQAIAPLRVAMEAAIHKPLVEHARGGIIDLKEVVRDFYQTDWKKDTLNTKAMNEKNFEHLEKQIKFTGFGEQMGEALKKNIEQGQPAFTLNHETSYGTDKVNAALQFKKSNQTDMYFFNSYNLQVQKEGKEPSPEQTFYVNFGNTITLKEGYNLMEGRAVNKDLINQKGENYNAWLQFDFKNTDDKGNFKLNHYHENYGFKLEEALAKHPIKELARDDYKENLMDSLKKGNLQSATFVKDGQEIKQFIEASPQFKTVNLYDSTMQRQDNRKSQENKQQEGQEKDQKKGHKESVADGGGDESSTTAKNSRKRQSQGMS